MKMKFFKEKKEAEDELKKLRLKASLTEIELADIKNIKSKKRK